MRMHKIVFALLVPLLFLYANDDATDNAVFLKINPDKQKQEELDYKLKEKRRNSFKQGVQNESGNNWVSELGRSMAGEMISEGLELNKSSQSR
ncbi:MAG: hypothetical protein PHE67_07310 [Campylobacterales bacterium]|nr:hypothetical protein [Campylobacterales bacterium]